MSSIVYVYRPGADLTTADRAAFQRAAIHGHDESITGLALFTGAAAMIAVPVALLSGLITTFAQVVVDTANTGTWFLPTALITVGITVLGGALIGVRRMRDARRADALSARGDAVVISERGSPRTYTAITPARRALADVPTDSALYADVAADISALSWRLARTDADSAALAALDTSTLSPAARTDYDAAVTDVEDTRNVLIDRLTDLTGKVSAANEQDAFTSHGARTAAIAAVAARAKELRAPDPQAISGDLLDAYTTALVENR